MSRWEVQGNEDLPPAGIESFTVLIHEREGNGYLVASLYPRYSSAAQCHDNAYKIVRAVNAYDDLLAAAEAANRYLAEMAQRGGPREGMGGIMEWSEVQFALSQAIKKARNG